MQDADTVGEGRGRFLVSSFTCHPLTGAGVSGGACVNEERIENALQNLWFPDYADWMFA